MEQTIPVAPLQQAWPETLPPEIALQLSAKKAHAEITVQFEHVQEVLPFFFRQKCMEPDNSPFL